LDKCGHSRHHGKEGPGLENKIDSITLNFATDVRK
jgi:hypothetical protein